MILFHQLKRRFNLCKLKTQKGAAFKWLLCSHFCQEIFPKSNDKCAEDVLLLPKMCYLWDSMIDHEHFVLAGRLHRFHKNLFSFTVLFVKLCSSAAQSTLLIVTEPGVWMGCPVAGKENMWLSSYRTPHSKSCACSKNTHFWRNLIC